MKTWQAISAFVAASLLLVGVLLFLDERHQSVKAAEFQKEALELVVVQSAAKIQAGVSANQLQLMQWELNDINARIIAGKTQIADASRKVVLEARIKALAVAK